MKQQLTNRQAEVLEHIKQFIAKNGYPPSTRDVMELAGISSPNGAVCHLRALEAKGHIRRNERIARSIVVLD